MEKLSEITGKEFKIFLAKGSEIENIPNLDEMNKKGYSLLFSPGGVTKDAEGQAILNFSNQHNIKGGAGGPSFFISQKSYDELQTKGYINANIEKHFNQEPKSVYGSGGLPFKTITNKGHNYFSGLKHEEEKEKIDIQAKLTTINTNIKPGYKDGRFGITQTIILVTALIPSILSFAK